MEYGIEADNSPTIELGMDLAAALWKKSNLLSKCLPKDQMNKTKIIESNLCLIITMHPSPTNETIFGLNFDCVNVCITPFFLFNQLKCMLLTWTICWRNFFVMKMRIKNAYQIKQPSFKLCLSKHPTVFRFQTSKKETPNVIYTIPIFPLYNTPFMLHQNNL